MATVAHHRIQQYAGVPGVSLAAKGKAAELVVLRNDVEVRVLVPENVLEWFVDVEQRGSGSRVSDWCDYEGYGGSPTPALEDCMAEDVAAFVNQLIERELRYVLDENRPTRGRLEWYVDGQWHQAIPFLAPAA